VLTEKKSDNSRGFRRLGASQTLSSSLRGGKIWRGTSRIRKETGKKRESIAGCEESEGKANRPRGVMWLKPRGK